MSRKSHTDIIKCHFCGQEHTRSNKSRHRKSKLCTAYQNAVKTYNEMLLSEGNKIKSFDDMIKKPYTDAKGKTIYLNNMQLKFVNKLKIKSIYIWIYLRTQSQHNTVTTLFYIIFYFFIFYFFIFYLLY